MIGDRVLLQAGRDPQGDVRGAGLSIGVELVRSSPQEFATEWSRLGGPQATQAMGQGLYVADAVSIPSGIPGRLRLATDGVAPLLREWADQFWAEAGARPSADGRLRRTGRRRGGRGGPSAHARARHPP